MKSNFPPPVPEIPVTDLASALDYYHRNLGFNLDWYEQEVGLASVSKGECRMFLASQSYRQGDKNPGPVLIWLNLDSKADVDDLHRSWSDSDAKLISAPESKPWGLHEFKAEDLDGNVFRVFYDFATPELEKRSPENRIP